MRNPDTLSPNQARPAPKTRPKACLAIGAYGAGVGFLPPLYEGPWPIFLPAEIVVHRGQLVRPRWARW